MNQPVNRRQFLTAAAGGGMLMAGGLLRQLDENGLSEETIVFFYSDHGTGLPRHKRWLYDSGIHVPLIVRS